MSQSIRLSLVIILALFFSVNCVHGWETVTPQQAGMNESKVQQARDYALTGGGSGCIIRGGKLVVSWGDQNRRSDLKSASKSIGVTVLGLALNDRLVNLDDKAQNYDPDIGIPPNAGDPRLADIKIWHLATHTAGFDKPGGFESLLFDPGTAWAYSDGGANWLADCLTLAYKQDLENLLFDRVYSKLGITVSDLTWQNNVYQPDMLEGVKRREFGSGISANVDAMAKIGYLYLRRGKWAGEQILPESFIETVRKPFPEIAGLAVRRPSQYFNASDHYSLLWWNNGDGTLRNVPRDADWSWGLYDSLIVVIPSLDIVGDALVDFRDFSRMALDWLQNEIQTDLAPAPMGDGFVDWKDFAEFAKSWLGDESLVAYWRLDETERILYADEMEVARDAVPYLAGATGGLILGAGGHLESGSFFSGRVDDVRIYDHVLSEIEISALAHPPRVLARDPIPSDGAIHEDTWVNLSWTAGSGRNCTLFISGIHRRSQQIHADPILESSRRQFFSDTFRHAGAQGFRHLHTTNVAFYDGHADFLHEIHIYMDPVSRDILEQHNQTHDNPIGFLSSDNRLYDLK